MTLTKRQRINAQKSRKENQEKLFARECLVRDFARMGVLREPTKEEINKLWNVHRDQDEMD